MISSAPVRSEASFVVPEAARWGSPSGFTWVMLWAFALTFRLWAAFYLPNAEQDGYSDAETIARLSAALSNGTFRLADLYGFWLPLFQLVAAIPNIWMHDSLLSGKIVSSLCGAVSCVLTFAIANRITQRVALSWGVFALVLLNPLHTLYSAACMTDVPFGCLTLASLWFLLKDRWLAATILAALAGTVRVEAWALIPLLPLLQYVRQRRVSLLAICILLLPPVGWLCIGQVANGNWFSFFSERALYHAHYLDFHPSRRGFALSDIRGDIDFLLVGANGLVFLGSVLVMVVLMVQWRRGRRISWPCLATGSYLFAIVGLLLVAYVTKRQPVWLPRYGLFAFVLGLPLVSWLLQQGMEAARPRWLGSLGAAAGLVACASLFQTQGPIIPHVMDDFRAHTQVAEALAADIVSSNDGQTRCFSDDVAVRVISGLPANRFLHSGDAPAGAWDNPAIFEGFLRDQHVGYLVVMPTEDSLPVQHYPELSRRPGPTSGRFQLITAARSSFGPDVWLYRLRD